MNPQSCANSPCAGLNGCTTYTEFNLMNKCLQESCYCTEPPYPTIGPTTTPPPVCMTCGPTSFCYRCGTMNQCDVPDTLEQRNRCLTLNCSDGCKGMFPMTPVSINHTRPA